MVKNDKIAIIGDEDVVLCFKVFGAKMFGVTDIAQAKKAIEDVKKQNYSIVYVAQVWAKQLKHILHPLPDETFPIFVVIPDGRTEDSMGLEKIKNAARKALGSDRLFEEQ
ncbi:hypothetical protein B9J78_02020 [bacterium Unc6]|nr:hypothetical protein [bacterium Unc6]